MINTWRDVATRFIPAGAGNTLASDSTLTACPVYPRWRGEHQQRYNIEGLTCGLSPLARGTPANIGAIIPEFRFIPAGAGNTGALCIPPRGPAVYPRWRGEHQRLTTKTIVLPGLSPLARGTRPQTEREEEITRFIPAGAGNTYEIRPLTVVCAVYPRWRGEHAAADVNGDMNNGLSPLARGTPGRCYCRSKPSRFIPAGAGNTSKDIAR